MFKKLIVQLNETMTLKKNKIKTNGHNVNNTSFFYEKINNNILNLDESYFKNLN